MGFTRLYRVVEPANSDGEQAKAEGGVTIKLWQKKDVKLDPEIEAFTVGNDFLLDQELVEFDCLASIAHAKMLEKAKVLNAKEVALLEKELKDIIQLNQQGTFKISLKDEDCHTKIENHLTEKLGEVGMKIHTGRSRNDQVQAALRLYSKKQLAEVKVLVKGLQQAINLVSSKHKETVMPGYSHMQKAMPSSVSLWLGAFADSLEDDLVLIDSAMKLIDCNPLGSAAGFGTTIENDRELTAKLLGFSKVQNNFLYVQNSRGKFEAVILHTLVQVMLDLNKLATDLLLFSTQEFGFIALGESICTGSSIMPHKKNPDVLELIRGNYSMLLGLLIQALSVIGSLPSGYNRDFQLTKEPLMKGFGLTKNNLKAMEKVFQNIKINEKKMMQACSEETKLTDKAIELAKEGVPFRKAYQKVIG